MVHFLHHRLFRASPDLSGLVLALCWIAGISFSALIYSLSGGIPAPLLTSVSRIPASVLSLAVASLLPWFFSWLAVILDRPRWLFGICFGKAWLYGYLCCGIADSFGSAGWLVRFLLLFDDSFGNVLLYMFWHHLLKYPTAPVFSRLSGSIAAVCFLAATDYCFISPLLHHSLL